jgi:hypothetical protein
MRDGWEPEGWERRQWWRKIVVGVVFLAACVVALVAWSSTLSGTLFGVFCVVFGGLGLLAVAMRYPGRAYGRPRIARLGDGTGPVDAVRFGARRAMVWCAAGACVLMAAAVFGALAYRARIHGLPPVSGTLGGPGAVFGYLFLALCALPVWAARMTRFVAVTPDALVLAHRRARVRVPWDHVAEARPVAEQGLAPMGHTVQRTTTRSIALIPYAHAVAAPEFLRVVRRFGGIRFLSRELGRVPMIDVDTLADPYALLRAVRWHLARPYTPDTLIEGYERGWPAADAPETQP